MTILFKQHSTRTLIKKAFVISAISAGLLSSAYAGTKDGIIGDKVWHDANANGIFDKDESGIADIEVRLYNQSYATIATTTTDETGMYTFSELDTSVNYIVQVIKAGSGLEFTTPFAGEKCNSSVVDDNGGTSLITLTDEDPTNFCVDAGMIGQLKRDSVAEDDVYTSQVGNAFCESLIENDTPSRDLDYTYYVSGDIAPGLELSADGQLCGEPTQTGSYEFFYNLISTSGSGDTAKVTLTIEAADLPPIMTEAPAACKVFNAYHRSYRFVGVGELNDKSFADQYNLYDRHGNLLTTLSSEDNSTIRQKRGYQRVEWRGNDYQIKLNKVHSISAINEGELESGKTACQLPRNYRRPALFNRHYCKVKSYNKHYSRSYRNYARSYSYYSKR